MIKFAAPIAALLLGWSPPAWCGWQYTRWGMTPDQVKTASSGSATENPTAAVQSTRTSDALLVSPFSIGTFRFRVYFLFDHQTRMLDRVSMELLDNALSVELYDRLVAQLGKPAQQETGPLARTARWADRRNRNVILWTTSGNVSTRLQYTELIEPGRSL